MAKKSPKIAIGYCSRSELSLYFHTSLMSEVDKYRNWVVDVISIMSSPKIDQARNDIVRNFLEHGKATHLLMLDTDMVIPKDTIPKLYNARKDIVSGLAFTGSFNGSNIAPNIRVIVDSPKGPSIVPLWDYPPNSLVKVNAVGAACLMVKKVVYEKILEARGENHPLPWFAHGAHNNVPIGEDVAFCLTAQKVGFDVWCDTGLILPHVKPRMIDERSYVVSLSDPNHPKHDGREEIMAYSKWVDGDNSS